MAKRGTYALAWASYDSEEFNATWRRMQYWQRIIPPHAW